MGDALRNAIVETGRRGRPIGDRALLDRVEARLNGERPSPFESRQFRPRWWDTVPGPVVAFAAAALVLFIVIGGAWLVRGVGTAERAPINEPEIPSPTTTVPATAVPVPTTLSPQAIEAPWVQAGEIRIESTVITKRGLSVEDGRVTLEYDVISLAPVGAHAEDEKPVPAVLPELWELETVHGTVRGTSSPTGRSVRFEVDETTTSDDVIAVRLIAWRTILPVTYDFTIPADAGASVQMPDASTIAVSYIVEMDEGVLVSFDTTGPPEYWWAVQCGDRMMIGESCFEPVPGSGWTPQPQQGESDSDLKITADADASPSSIALRYRRPLWIRSKGSIELPLATTEVFDAEPTAFPDGYVPLSDTQAIRPIQVVSYGNQVLVSMMSVGRRGVNNGTIEPFMGGRWLLETASGVTIESVGTVFNDFVDGAFTAVFSAVGNEPIVPVSLRLVETWDPGTRSRVVDVGPVEAIGDVLDVPVDVALDSNTMIRVERFDVEGIGGYGTWYVAGDDDRPVVADVTGAFLDRNTVEVAVTEMWGPPPRHFGLSNTGRLFWFWVGDHEDRSIGEFEDLLAEGGHRFEIRVSAEVPEPTPSDVVLDLRDVPVE